MRKFAVQIEEPGDGLRRSFRQVNFGVWAESRARAASIAVEAFVEPSRLGGKFVSDESFDGGEFHAVVAELRASNAQVVERDAYLAQSGLGWRPVDLQAYVGLGSSQP